MLCLLVASACCVCLWWWGLRFCCFAFVLFSVGCAFRVWVFCVGVLFAVLGVVVFLSCFPFGRVFVCALYFLFSFSPILSCLHRFSFTPSLSLILVGLKLLVVMRWSRSRHCPGVPESGGIPGFSHSVLNPGPEQQSIVVPLKWVR